MVLSSSSYLDKHSKEARRTKADSGQTRGGKARIAPAAAPVMRA
jgi:hypothetical protein